MLMAFNMLTLYMEVVKFLIEIEIEIHFQN